MIKRFSFLFILLLTVLHSFAQRKNKPEDFGFTAFAIKGTNDSVRFIVSDTAFKIKKPVFIYCQDSLPYALFYKQDSAHTWLQAFPFAYKLYRNDYRFVVISKPGIPVFTKTADEKYFYVDSSTHRLPLSFLQKNNFDYYVNTTNDVIDYLLKQHWVEKKRVVLAGHSQGAMVVAKVAAFNKQITHAVFLSGNPYSRFDQQIREIQKQKAVGEITPLNAQEKIDSLNRQMQYAYQHPTEVWPPSGEPFENITSFYDPFCPFF